MFEKIKQYFKDCETTEDFLSKLYLLTPEPKMYLRLRNLVKYFKAKNVNELDKITITTNAEHHKDIYWKFTFQTSQGLAIIQLSEVRDLDYYGFHYSVNNQYFEISAYIGDLKVKPMLGQNLLAKDIDLAVLELEQYLQDSYDKISVVWDTYCKEKDQQKREHEKQLKLLY